MTDHFVEVHKKVVQAKPRNYPVIPDSSTPPPEAL